MDALILLHGAIGSAEQLKPLGKLLENDYRIFYMDFPGHGSRSSEDVEFSMDNFKKELSSFIDHYKLTPHIFGYSMGGYVALMYADDNPNKVKSITTLGSKFHWDEETAEKEVRFLNPDAIEEKVPVFASALKAQHGDHWKVVLNKTKIMMLGLGKLNPIDHINYESINCPVSIGLSDDDEMVSIEETNSMANRLNANRFTIKDSKHPLEKTDLNQLAEVLRIHEKIRQ